MNKTKKTLSLILALIMVLTALPLTGITAFAYKSGDWEYTVSGGKATITDYTGSSNYITFPSTLGGYTVESVDYLLSCSRYVVTVTIPSTIKNMKETFYDWNALQSITVDSSNPNFSSKDGVLFNKNKTKIIAYPNAKPGTEYTIPEGVTTIGEFVFSQEYWYGKLYLEKVNIPSTLKVIEEHAFSGSTVEFENNRLVLPDGVTTIGYGAFLSCGLDSIVIPASVTSIGDLAVGYDWIRQHGEERRDDFVIFGVKGSTAESYAKANKITFCEIGEFPDVKEGAWYYDAVKYVTDKGYMAGYSNGRFGPADNLKRQDFVLIIARMAGANLSKYESKSTAFKDVKKGAYYYSAVIWAVENGIIGGYSSTKFGVGDNVTREQVATILYRCSGSPTVGSVDSTLSKFSDVKSISSYAKMPLAWAVQNKIISGMADGRAAPKEGASRAQIAMIIMRIDQQNIFKQ